MVGGREEACISRAGNGVSAGFSFEHVAGEVPVGNQMSRDGGTGSQPGPWGQELNLTCGFGMVTLPMKPGRVYGGVPYLPREATNSFCFLYSF